MPDNPPQKSMLQTLVESLSSLNDAYNPFHQASAVLEGKPNPAQDPRAVQMKERMRSLMQSAHPAPTKPVPATKPASKPAKGGGDDD